MGTDNQVPTHPRSAASRAALDVFDRMRPNGPPGYTERRLRDILGPDATETEMEAARKVISWAGTPEGKPVFEAIVDAVRHQQTEAAAGSERQRVS